MTGTPGALAEAGGSAPPRKVRVPVREALATAGQLYQAGRLPQAETVSRQILAAQPDNPDAHNLLGVILNARGFAEDGVAELKQAIKLRPKEARYQANLGEIERQRGKLPEARKALERAIKLDPNSAQAYSNLGIVCFDEKDFAAAAANYEKAIALQPEFPEAHNNLGNAYRALDRLKDAIACYQKAVTQRAGYPEAYNNMATALRDSQDYDSAEHAYRKAIMLKPDYMEPYNNLSLMLLYRDRTDEALRVLAEALKIDDKNITTLLNVAKVQNKRGAHEVAEQATRMAINIDPDKAEAYNVLAQTHHEADRHEEALASIVHAIELEPEAADYHSFHGVVLKSLGRLDEARAAIHKALEISPDFFAAYSNLNDLEDFEAGHDLLAKMQEILAKAEDPEAERYISIYFAVGKALEDAGDYPEALRNYAVGARLHRATLKYDEADTAKFFDQIKTTFTADLFANRPWTGNPAKTPVFIVGMPRSGSTLVEQILSSHPQVFGAGEVKVLHHVMGVLRDRLPSIPKFPGMVKALEPVHFQEIADGYLRDVSRDAGAAARVTDKLLTNFFFAGFINILFPNAKIIHTRRNPVDSCLSTYTKLFKDDMPHSYEFGELGRYYLRYEDLMKHWEAVLPPGVMMSVDYESVIADLDTNARALVDHIGLEWDDACLAFHESKRAVKTASVVQVRRPVYKTSVERWKRYGDGLQPLVEALNWPRPA